MSTTTPNARLSFIQQQLPTLDILDTKTDNTGWDYAVIVINNEWIFRFPRRQGAGARLLLEQSVLQSLNQSLTTGDLRIPNYHLLYNENATPVCCYYQMIQGMPLTPALLHSLTPSQQQNIATQLGNFLTKLHALDVGTLRPHGLTHQHDITYWSNIWRDIQTKVLPLLNPFQQNWTRSLFEGFLQTMAVRTLPQTLIHGDLSSAHILYDQNTGQLSGIIDFGDAQIGDPAYDFSGLYWDYGASFTQQAIHAYRPNPLHGNDADLYTRVASFYGNRPIFHSILYALEQKSDQVLAKSLAELDQFLNRTQA